MPKLHLKAGVETDQSRTVPSPFSLFQSSSSSLSISLKWMKKQEGFAGVALENSFTTFKTCGNTKLATQLHSAEAIGAQKMWLQDLKHQSTDYKKFCNNEYTNPLEAPSAYGWYHLELWTVIPRARPDTIAWDADWMQPQHFSNSAGFPWIPWTFLGFIGFFQGSIFGGFVIFFILEEFLLLEECAESISLSFFPFGFPRICFDLSPFLFILQGVLSCSIFFESLAFPSRFFMHVGIICIHLLSTKIFCRCSLSRPCQNQQSQNIKKKT